MCMERGSEVGRPIESYLEQLSLNEPTEVGMSSKLHSNTIATTLLVFSLFTRVNIDHKFSSPETPVPEAQSYSLYRVPHICHDVLSVLQVTLRNHATYLTK